QSLEAVRTVSRIAPMLGLIATMIPMGPALKSLADGNVQGISENLIVAFSAVIFGLVIATVTFWIASIKKRWLAVELAAIGAMIDSQQQPEQEALLREAA
ncbi:MAG: MotA/TolQ/ExbB proton channel family protein, partial [Psychrosphaera sp.]|nr:MotA/TolQ/ExbB proton channel family protein [Psychrosphaera sp.]